MPLPAAKSPRRVTFDEPMGANSAKEPPAPETPPASGVPAALPDSELPPPTIKMTLRALACPSLLTLSVRSNGLPG